MSRMSLPNTALRGVTQLPQPVGGQGAKVTGVFTTLMNVRTRYLVPDGPTPTNPIMHPQIIAEANLAQITIENGVVAKIEMLPRTVRMTVTG